MFAKGLGLLAAAAIFCAGANAALCTADLQIDNFGNFNSALNSLNEATSGMGTLSRLLGSC